MKIVQFRDGTFGYRKGNFLFGYMLLTRNSTWVSVKNLSGNEIDKNCKFASVDMLNASLPDFGTAYNPARPQVIKLPEISEAVKDIVKIANGELSVGEAQGLEKKLAAVGKKIEAIKLLRNHTGCMLHEAKDIVEKMPQYPRHPDLV